MPRERERASTRSPGGGGALTVVDDARDSPNGSPPVRFDEALSDDTDDASLQLSPRAQPRRRARPPSRAASSSPSRTARARSSSSSSALRSKAECRAFTSSPSPDASGGTCDRPVAVRRAATNPSSVASGGDLPHLHA